MSSQGRDSCGDRRDDLAAYALGALADSEATALEDHLSTCSACGERLRWLQPAVDLLPASVRQQEPPAELRESLMATVHEEAAAEVPAEPADSAAPRKRSRFSLPGFKIPRLAPMGPALAGLAAVAMIAAGVGGYAIGTGDESGGAEEYAVQPLSPKFAAEGTFEVSDGSGALVVDNLRPISKDQVYQVWTAEADADPEPSSVFVVDNGGNGTAVVPDLPDGTDRVLVTVEPAGGSKTPTTAPILAAQFD